MNLHRCRILLLWSRNMKMNVFLWSIWIICITWKSDFSNTCLAWLGTCWFFGFYVVKPRDKWVTSCNNSPQCQIHKVMLSTCSLGIIWRYWHYPNDEMAVMLGCCSPTQYFGRLPVDFVLSGFRDASMGCDHVGYGQIDSTYIKTKHIHLGTIFLHALHGN